MVKTPVTPSIEKNAASAPPVIEYVTVWPASSSAATTVVTAVTFSATFIAAVAPPPLDVITGASADESVTVAVIVCVSVFVPSLTWTITTYVLFVSASVGISKFGAESKVKTPEVG